MLGAVHWSGVSLEKWLLQSATSSLQHFISWTRAETAMRYAADVNALATAGCRDKFWLPSASNYHSIRLQRG